MDMGTAFAGLNWFAIFGAAAAAFIAGAIWYGPVFGQAWMADFGFQEADFEGRNNVRVFGLTFVLNVITAINLGMFLGPNADITFGIAAGFFTGFGFFAALLGVYYLFENRPFRIFLINGGFGIVNFTLMGAILGAFK